MTVCQNPTTAGIGNTADNTNERRFACAIGTEQGKNFSFINIQIDVFQGLKAVGVSL